MPWLIVNSSHLHHYASEMAPDHVSGERLVVGYFGLTPISIPDQTLEINVLGFGVDAMLDC